ncbi:Methyltransferase-like protein 25 [Gamsiella multidivaricata]|nr:Methyltransferase-like protein 25 [Gamsiella multidivaricata]
MDRYSIENEGLAGQAGAHSSGDSTFTHNQQEREGIRAFLPPGFDSLEEYLACLQSFLASYEPITNLMIVDYFTTNSWETRMPKDWRDAFESEQGKLSSLDLMELVSLGKLRDLNTTRSNSTATGSESPAPQDWPESLKEFVRMVKKLSINRTLDPDFTKFKNTLDSHLTPGMSPKKLHEVEILSGLIALYAKEHAIGSVIDLGAGQGYLSRVLAFQHHLRVLGIDSNTIQTCGAQTTQKRTEKLFVNKSKLKSSASLCDTQFSATDKQQQSQSPATIDSANDPDLATTPGSNFQLQHITHHITASTLPTLLKEHFPKKSKPLTHCEGNSDLDGYHKDDAEEEGRWTLCGLHACGDLTSNMIKLYLESSATCLFSVGCCYHCITEKFDKDGNIAISDGTHGFPLSAAFNRHKAHLGEHAKMTACQSPERWLKYRKETEDAIHGHYFRALLHKLMVERGLYPGPPMIAPVLGRMGKHRLKGFPHYLSIAIDRLELPIDVIRPEEAQAAYEEFLEKDLYRIGILWALRTMLGPLFEGMILLDRATYLHESVVGNGDKSNGNKGLVQLVAGFDVVESPRNMILIAIKD